MISHADVIVITYVRDERFDKTLQKYIRSKITDSNTISAENNENIPGDKQNISQYSIPVKLQSKNKLDQHLLMRNNHLEQLINSNEQKNNHQTISTDGLKRCADQMII